MAVLAIFKVICRPPVLELTLAVQRGARQQACEVPATVRACQMCVEAIDELSRCENMLVVSKRRNGYSCCSPGTNALPLDGMLMETTPEAAGTNCASSWREAAQASCSLATENSSQF
jgi:hypothetical protein